MEQLSFFDAVPQKQKIKNAKRKLRSDKQVIKALTDFQSIVVEENDTTFNRLKKLVKEQESAELVAYTKFVHADPYSVILKKDDTYDLGYAKDKVKTYDATTRKSMWCMTGNQWNWRSTEDMRNCIEWIDKNVVDDDFEWKGFYKNALGNNWCWMYDRGIFG